MSEWSEIIPARYLKASGYEWDWPNNKGPLLYGPVGIGKTYSAAALAMATEHPYYTAWVPVVRYFEDMRRRMDGVEVSLPNIRRARLIVLDDLGKERPSEWTFERFFDLLDEAWNRNVRLIVTSNLHPDKLKLHMSEASYDRLVALTTCVPMEGESRRHEAA